ncbi:MAG: hypothetical protein KDC70_00310 [Saprospiraceae bacterium]|nr:hypothetical protein [Saprospiraceae bacterium]
MKEGDKRLKNLKPFKEGHDERRNLKGRTPGIPNTATRLQRFLDAIRIAENPLTGKPEKMTVAEEMDLMQVAKALKGDTVAWDKLLDRLEGKATQKNEHSGPDGGDIPIAQTVIQIKFRPKSDQPTESSDPQKPKGRRKAG